MSTKISVPSCMCVFMHVHAHVWWDREGVESSAQGDKYLQCSEDSKLTSEYSESNQFDGDRRTSKG